MALLVDVASLRSDLSFDNTLISAFSVGDNTRTAQFLQSYKFPFSVQHAGGHISQQFEIKNVPTVFLMDNRGVLRYRWIGRRSKVFIQEVVSEYISTGRIPIQALTSKTPFLYQRIINFSKYFQNDTSFTGSLHRLFMDFSPLTEIIETKKVDGEYVVDHYIAYGNTCKCDDGDSSSYTLVSLLIDRKSDSLVDQHLIENVTMSYINNYLKIKKELFHAYSN